MAESDFSNSPLMDPNFAKQNPASDMLAGALDSPQFRQQAVISSRNDTNFSRDSEMARDLQSMDYYQLSRKYGEEVAGRQGEMRDEMVRQNSVEDAEQSLGQIVGDSALGAAGAFVDVVGGGIGLGISGIGAVDKYFDPENTAISEYAVDYGEATSVASDFIRGFQSQELQNKQELNAGLGQLQSADSQERYDNDIASGQSPFAAGLRQVGTDVLNSGARTIEDPAILRDTITSALGSLGPSVKVAGAGVALAEGIMTRIGGNSLKAQAAARALGSSAGVGLVEANGAYSDTVATVMAMSHEDLMRGSPSYADQIANNVDPELARMIVAADTGQSAFLTQLPAAMALGLVGGKFESSPIGAFRGAGLVGALRQVGTQTLEEAGQGGSATISSNYVIGRDVNPEQTLAAGVGESVAVGAIAGAGMAGALGAPGTALTAVRSAGSTIADALNSDTELGGSIRDTRLAAQGVAANAVDATARGVSAAASVVAPVLKPVTDRVAPIATAAASAVKDRVVDPAFGAVEDFADRSDPAIQTETVVAAETAQTALDTVITSTPDNVTPSIAAIAQTKDEAPVPESFAANVAPESTVLQSVAGIMKSVASKEVKIRTMATADTLYAAERISALREQSASLPAAVKNQVNKVLASKDLIAIETAAKKINLNETMTPDLAVTPESTAVTLSVAKTNPVNVNPGHVSKILKQDDIPLTGAQRKILEVAAKMATAVNNHEGEQISISRNKSIALSQKPAYVGKAPKVLTPESVSRSVQVDGFNGMRSFNDFGADILKGIQSTNGTFVDSNGYTVKVGPVVEQFRKLVTHMNNKTGALNESVQLGVNGKGKTVMFESLSRTGKMIPAGQAGGAAGVYFHASSPTSVELAQTVAADARVGVEVYNAMAEAFPEVFPEGLIAPVELIQEQAETTATQETQELEAPVDTVENTTAVDEADVASETPVEEVIAVEEAVQDPAEQETPESTLVTYVKESLSDALSNGYEFTFETSASLAGTSPSKKTVNLDVEAIEADFNAGLTYLDGVQGETSEQKKVVFENIDVAEFKAFIQEAGVKAYIDFIVAHEARHIEQLSEGQKYPADLLDHQAISMERDANQAGFEAIGFTPTVEVAPSYENLDPRFNETFPQDGAETEYTDGASVLGLVEAQGKTAYTAFAKPLLQTLVEGVNKRLAKVTMGSKKDNRKLVDVLKTDEDVAAIMRFKAAVLVDPTTGLYDQSLISLAAVGVVDWITAVRASDPHKLADTLEDLGLNARNLTEAQLQSIAFGVPPQQAAEQIAKAVLKLWNTTVNKSAPMVDSRGIVEGIVKELLTVLGNDTDMMNIEEIPTIVDGVERVAQTLNVKPAAEAQKDMGMLQQGAVQSLIAPELDTMPSIGEKIAAVDQTQSRGDVPLSDLEKAAEKAMQDTPHRMSQGITAFTEALGFEFLAPMLGWVDMETFKGNKTLARSVEGKNISIERDFEDAIQLVEAIRETDEFGNTEVFYRVGISKVGRHQFKGINPQNNKILRALVTPTHATLNMTTKDDSDAFWLTVAQGSELAKVENTPHDIILKTIESKFDAQYGAAVDIALGFMKTGEVDGAAFAAAMGEASMAQINTVMAVAQLNFAKEQGTLDSFDTTISFELDGKTDGPGNMMANFGQGLLTYQDMHNFEKVGYFLGKVGRTLNEYFGAGNKDLYETTSRTAELLFTQMAVIAEGSDKEALYAAQRFAGKFGDFKVNEDGSIEMTRNTAKNPMTKTVYGSGVSGVASGIAQAMELEFYRTLVNLPDGTDLDAFPGYPQLQQDIKTLFGESLPNVLNKDEFQFSERASKNFVYVTSQGIGQILSEASKKTIGDPITKVNDMLVFLTNVQSDYLAEEFKVRLDALVAEQIKSGQIKNGLQLSQKDYDALVAEMKLFAPLYSSGNQDLAVGSFSRQAEPGDQVLSSNLGGSAFRQPSTQQRPDNAGVKVIPYVSIGRGDAMMMNRIYGAKNAPTNTLPVFDGIDMPVNMVKVYADQINEAVQANWDTDVLVDIVADFESFVRHVGSDPKLQAAYNAVMERSENTTVVAENATELLEAVRNAHTQNLARKKAFKRIPTSVDHMGGSGKSYSRGEDRDQMTMSEINLIIKEELDKLEKDETTFELSESYTELKATTAGAMVKAVLRGGNPTLAKTVRAIQNKIPKNMKVITGSLAQLNAYRIENFPDDGQILSGAGNYDTENNVLFLAKDSTETLVHELVHAATFGQLLSHFEGNTDAAVTRLEGLMAEFQGLDFSSSTQATQDSVNSARDAILEYQTDGTAFNKAAALNEFMAWSLTNERLSAALKTTRTSAVSQLTKKVKALFQRMMNGVPNDMFSSILFNTSLLTKPTRVEPEADPIQLIEKNESEELTPQAYENTNRWMDLIKEVLENTKSAAVGTKLAKAKQLEKYQTAAHDAVDSLDQAFTMSDYEKQTFRAIHMSLATEMRLDANSLIAMNTVYEWVTNNLSPEMFDGDKQEKFSVVMELLTSETDGKSEAIASLLALSQTSKGFRRALENMPTPPQTKTGVVGINTFLTGVSAFMMKKFTGSIDTAGVEMAELLDTLSKNIIELDSDKDFTLVRGLMAKINTADAYTSGAMSAVADRTAALNNDVRVGNRSKLLKGMSSALTVATSFLSESRTKESMQGAKMVTHMGVDYSWAIPIQEFVTEIVGTDANNKTIMRHLDSVNYAVSSMRQAFRESLPKILQDAFTNKPEADEWNSMHSVLGQADFAAVFDLADVDGSFDLIRDPAALSRKITAAEAVINNSFDTFVASDIRIKAQQLADFMNNKGAGQFLWPNAHAINTLAGGYKASLTADIDALASLYAIQGADAAQVAQVVTAIENDPEGVRNLMVYTQGLKKQEEQKSDISDEAIMNAQKGFMPNTPAPNVKLEIHNDAEREQLIKMGFKRVADAPADADFSTTARGYYTTSIKQGGAYSQGGMQSVQASYFGVSMETGFPDDNTSGYITDPATVATITAALDGTTPVDPKEVLRPIFDSEGFTVAYVRAINPDMSEKYLGRDGHMAQMMGVWAGRQVEEKQAEVYNANLVTELKSIYDNRAPGDDGLYINLASNNLKDPIYKDSWRVIPPATKRVIEAEFGEKTFMVRRDQINLALGYRDPSIVDIWTGKTRMPEPVQKLAKAAAEVVMGKYAVSVLSKGEEITQSSISYAKDIIVVRSLVVPYMNMQANVFQLNTRGVGTKDAWNGYRSKMAEIEQHNENVIKTIELDAQIALLAGNQNKIDILESQKKVLADVDARMSIAPMITAGAYKNISEGITDADIELTAGRFGQWVDKQADRLPAGVQTVGKTMLMSKDTKLYQLSNKAVQYGDFLSKSIYYDHLVNREGKTPDEALDLVNEEFVNFSPLPGRTRTGLDAMGGTWFLTFKIRIMKIALSQLQNNPARALIINSTVGQFGSPVMDNLATVFAQGRLDYSIGWDMLWGAPELNPWMQAVDFAND